ncbi:glycine/D-amino acid oxidase-like deaminating enzyme [Micromonospora sp. M71_S20]|uniref:FAD-dependent oxidoreductase n=1 Tax=Micromonospora sp. M71_S20 TaxID=592872 RepID=UPI000EB08A63|nr:FAD-dependent oxidoreductase [Micromonospora sp. M71_S20]RLK25438.1 glycine/D-amino acid oxidase-like deaminating enzyme [Micromonospora sp. M71_S20]
MANADRTFDVAVIGGGAVGLAAAWQASAAGLSVVLFERGPLFHDNGSSGGAERQWRVQYSEEPLARLVLASVPMWDRLEQAIDRPLIHRTGSLWFGDIDQDSNEGQIRAAADVLERLSLRYEWLGARDIEKRYGFADLPEHYQGFHQPDGGVIDVRGTLWALYTLAVASGAEIRPQVTVLGLEPTAADVEVATVDGSVRARAVVVAAGAGTTPLLEALGLRLGMRTFEMPSAYFRLRDPSVDYPTWFAFEPTTEADDALYYGFGRNPWGRRDVVRVAPDSEAHPLPDAAQATGVPRDDDLRGLSAWVARHLPNLEPTPLQASTCLVTLPEEHHQAFRVGRVPGAERVVYCTSGWIFKFVPMLGQVCVDLALRGAVARDVADLLPGS